MDFSVVIITHGKIGQEMVKAVEAITHQKSGFIPISISPNTPLCKIDKKIEAAIKKTKKSAFTLLLTDVFGATPCNETLPLLKKKNIEIITGVNLPMLLKLATQSLPHHSKSIASYLCNYGKKNICNARDMLTR